MDAEPRTVQVAAWSFALALGLATALTTSLVRSGALWLDPSFQAALLALPFIVAAMVMADTRRASQILVTGMALAAWFFTWRIQGSGYFVGNYAYLVVIVIAAAFLLRPKETMALAAANIVVIVAVWQTTGLAVSDLILSLVYQVLFSALLIGLAGHLAAARDDARGLADALHAAHAGLRRMVASSWDGLVIVEEDGINCNPRAYDWLFAWHGRTDLAPEEMFPGAPVALWRARADASGETEEEVTIDTRIGPRHLRVRWISAKLARRESVLIRDLTDQDRQAELERARAREQAELEKLRDQRAWQERFMNMASHELRTPITPIRLHLDLVRDQMDPASFRVLDRNMRRLQHLINEVVELTRLQQDRLPIHAEAFDLSALVEDHVTMWAPVAQAKGLSWVTQVQPGIMAHADPSRVSEVLDNILSNATKYTPQGHVQITLRGGDAVALEVRDSGRGFESGDVDTVFAPFGRLPAHEDLKGTGLGMAISQEIMQRMGGHLDAYSGGPGTGATFTMRMPIAGRQAEEPTPGSDAGPVARR